MSETKWTPGPWSMDGYGHVYTADGQQLLMTGVALPNGNHPKRKEAEANARLIAAAPDLYAALDELIDIVGGDFNGLQNARRALAKARGE